MSITHAIDDEGNHVPGTGMKWVGPERCGEEVFIGGECIGAKGHEGVHFCYDSHGGYCWDDPDPDSMIAAGQTPAGHKEWPHPVDKAKETYLGMGGWVPISDEEVDADDW